MVDGPDLVGTVLADTYKLERLIGEGGMGAVYEASHARLRRRFAVKMLYAGVAAKSDLTARFRQEALVTSELGHPHIVEVVDFNHTEKGTPYIVMELLVGQPLDTLIAKGPLDLGRAAAIFKQVASALQAAHQRGIIHRDLKPPNIFLCSNAAHPDFVKVVDFGISKVVGSQSVVTRTQATMGTPNYMSPEQAEGRAAEVDARTDVYALGTILYELLAGRTPFFGHSIPTMLYKIVHEQPPPLASLRQDLPASVVEAVHHSLSKDPDKRFPTMDKFAEAIDEAMKGANLPASPITAATDPQLPLAPPDPGTAAGVYDPTMLPDGTAPGPTHQTTLSGGAGEVQTAAAVVPAKSGFWFGLFVAIGIGLLLAGGAGITAWLAFSDDEPGKDPVAAATIPPEPKKPSPKPKTPHEPAKPEIKPTPKPAPAPKPKLAPPKAAMRVIQVKSKDPRLHCTLQPKGRRSKIPCRFEVKEGTEVRLRVDRRGYRPFKVRWTVKGDKTYEVELVRSTNRVQLAGAGGKQTTSKAASAAPLKTKKPAKKRPVQEKKTTKAGGGWDFP